MKNNPLRILLVEDNPPDARLVLEMLKESENQVFNVTHSVNLAEALDELNKQSFETILLDLNVPDSFGLETLERVVAKSQSIPIIVLTGNNDERVGAEAIHKQATDYLVKGRIDSALLIRSIRYAIERKKNEEAIRKSEEAALGHALRLQAVLDAAPAIIWIAHDKQCQLITGNRAAYEFLRVPQG